MQARARQFLFYPAPRGGVSRATKAAVADNASPESAPPGARGLHAMGYLAQKSECAYNQALVAQMQNDLDEWQTATDKMSTKQQFNAVIAGIDLNLKYRITAWVKRLNQSLSYRAEAFQPGFEVTTLPTSVRHVIALEQRLSAGVPFATLDLTRDRLLRLTDELTADARSDKSKATNLH